MEDKDKNIEELEAEIKRLQSLVYYDELTGLYNRRGFLEAAQSAFQAISFRKTELERRIRFQIPFSVVFADIDNFKNINDTYGHDVGDEVLKAVGEALRSHQRSSDIYGRLGGEEFVTSLVGADSETAQLVAEKLRKTIEEINIEANGEKVPVTGSFGVITYSNEESLEELIRKADKAMYQAKQEGKNRVVVFS